MRDASTEPPHAAQPGPAQGHGAGEHVQAKVKARTLMQPLRVGTRGSPLALVQTRAVLRMVWDFCPVLRSMDAFQEVIIKTTGDTSQESGERLADIGGKGLWAKEIHEALLDRRIDFAVHSLKDLETELPPGIVLGCTLKREDARDALILGLGMGKRDPLHPFDHLPQGAVIGTSSVRRQSQLLHARPDLTIVPLRGNVQTRLDKVRDAVLDGTLLALAGLRRLGLDQHATVLLDPQVMVPSACQGIVGVTVRADDVELHEILAAIEDPPARAKSQAERALLAELDGTCRTPIGAYAHLHPATGELHVTGLVARADGTFLLKRSLSGPKESAAHIGRELGKSLRADSPSDIFAE
jgi:hydroxymethylbilane synthase